MRHVGKLEALLRRPKFRLLGLPSLETLNRNTTAELQVAWPSEVLRDDVAGAGQHASTTGAS